LTSGAGGVVAMVGGGLRALFPTQQNLHHSNLAAQPTAITIIGNEPCV